MCPEEKGLWRVIKYSRNCDKKTRPGNTKCIHPTTYAPISIMAVKGWILEFHFYSNVRYTFSSSRKYTRVNYILFISHLKFTSQLLNLLFVLKIDVSLIDYNLIIKHELFYFNLSIVDSQRLKRLFLSLSNIFSPYHTNVPLT